MPAENYAAQTMRIRLRRSIRRTCAALLIALAAAAPARAADAELYRIFLVDGTTLVSYGEYARVADRVVFSVPVGDADGSNLQLVSIGESTVDWDRTERYTHAVRARQYIATRGDADFAMLGNRVTEALNDIRLTADPRRRLEMAEEARTNLARWPAQNFGYRAAEVGQLVAMLDEVISEMRVAAGQTDFELSLVATTVPELPVPLLPAPGRRELLEGAVSAARAAADPGDRLSLMRAVAAALKEPAREEPWAAALDRSLSAEIAAEVRVDAAYRDLAGRTMASAAARARRADVRGVEALTRGVLQADERLGRRRPQEMSALLAYMDLRLDEARRLRLARDMWELRLATFAAYKKDVATTLDPLRSAKSWLEDVRDMSGPRPYLLDRYEQRIVMARRAFDVVTAPPELESARGLYSAAFQMARRAASTRRNAVSSNDMKLAWEASSAAAGAIMLLARADEELARLTTPPK